MANEMKQASDISSVAFVAACWAFKRRQRVDEPTADEFGICGCLAEVLARQVQIEFEHRAIGHLLKQKAA